MQIGYPKEFKVLTEMEKKFRKTFEMMESVM
jgi:hypothetical protein